MIRDLLIAAVVTPFNRDCIAERPFADLVAWLIGEGVTGITPACISGEGSTLMVKERTQLVRVAVEAAGRRAPVIPATVTHGTDATIHLTRQAKRAGADAALVVVPYYSRPSREGIWRHFEAVARAVDLEILVHNPIARTGVELSPATVARIAPIPSIVGIVDEVVDQRCRQLIADFAGDAFQQLCGSDEHIGPALASGCSGCLSTLANVVPSLCVALQRACMAGDVGSAFGCQAALNRLRSGLGAADETAAIKSLLAGSRPGFGRAMRLPLLGLPDETASKLGSAFEALAANASRLCTTQLRVLADLEFGPGPATSASDKRTAH